MLHRPLDKRSFSRQAAIILAVSSKIRSSGISTVKTALALHQGPINYHRGFDFDKMTSLIDINHKND